MARTWRAAYLAYQEALVVFSRVGTLGLRSALGELFRRLARRSVPELATVGLTLDRWLPEIIAYFEAPDRTGRDGPGREDRMVRRLEGSSRGAVRAVDRMSRPPHRSQAPSRLAVVLPNGIAGAPGEEQEALPVVLATDPRPSWMQTVPGAARRSSSAIERREGAFARTLAKCAPRACFFLAWLHRNLPFAEGADSCGIYVGWPARYSEAISRSGASS